MFLKAGAVSIVLLLLSRLMGLLRESALAAAFGASGWGDLAVLMLTLPDWLTGVAVSGALAYVLLPQWATLTPARQSALQATVGRWLLGMGLFAAIGAWWWRELLLMVLAPGLDLQRMPDAAWAMRWVALATPAALLAALWVTRLQHAHDFVGMYGANLVVNGGLAAVLAALAGWHVDGAGGPSVVMVLGGGLCAVMLLRLWWLGWRCKRQGAGVTDVVDSAVVPALESASPFPPASLWCWAVAAAGLPLVLPFVARTWASGAGEGALVTFNYAWKMVELPLLLAVQLVATVAFPSVTRAVAAGDVAATQGLLRQALALAWVLACAATLALVLGAQAIAALLFGWGRMDASALSVVAQWGSVGAWGLLPQSVIAVAVTVLAAQGRLRVVALTYAVACGAFWAWAPAGGDGQGLMAALNVVLTGVAVCLLAAVATHQCLVAVLPLSAMLVSLAVLLAGAWVEQVLGVGFEDKNSVFRLIMSGFSASVLIAIAWMLSPDVRHALRR